MIVCQFSWPRARLQLHHSYAVALDDLHIDPYDHKDEEVPVRCTIKKDSTPQRKGLLNYCRKQLDEQVNFEYSLLHVAHQPIGSLADFLTTCNCLVFHEEY